MSDNKKPNNPRAFPESCTDDGHRGNIDPGMTMRDYFAAKAMQGLCVNNKTITIPDLDYITQTSYEIADTMLKVREENG